MSDPIKDLEDFGREGATMNPLPPSEVRRRGDRIRRRRNGLAGVGAVAAVAVIATSGAFLAGGLDRTAEPAPGPAQGSSRPPTSTTSPSGAEQTIPADFPLDIGMGGAEVTDTGEMDDLDYCGRMPLADINPTDVRTAQVAGGETLVTRTLYLLDDQDASRAAQTAVLDAARSCAAEKTPDGTVTIQPVDADWPGNTVATDLGQGAETEPTVQVVNVMSNGPAVLVTQVWGSWTGNVQVGVKESRKELERLVPELELFGESAGPLEPSDDASNSDSGTSETTGTAPSSDIRADFPLAAGWPDDSTAESKDMGLEGPNRKLESLEFRACGKASPDPEHADRLRATWSNPEDFRERQLTTYADVDEAVAAVADLIATQEACPKDPERSDGYETQRTVRKVQAGGEAWVILERDIMNGDASPFGSSTMVIRTGSSVLVIRHEGHGGYPDGNGQGQVDAMLKQASEPIAAMCTFTKAGC